MKLSVCLVTRNDEKNLPRVLGSVNGIADEVIVAETGSTDGTLATAQSLGAKVSLFPWDDDFSAARNYALEQAGGEWILWLNPDEELDAGSRHALTACLDRADVVGYLVQVDELARPDQPDTPMQTWQERLFRRDAGVRFIGRLHPHFTAPWAELARAQGRHIARANIVIRHHAYQSELTRGKLRWAVRLLEKELQDRPGQLHYLIEYGRHLLWLNDPRGHEVLAQAAALLHAGRNAAAPPPDLALTSLLEYLLTVSPEQSKSPLTALDARELAWRWFPNSPPLLWSMAQQAFAANDYATAARVLEGLLALGRTRAYDRGAAFDPAIIGERALLNLWHCYFRLGDLNRAEQCYNSLLQSPAHQEQVRRNLADIHNLRAKQSKDSD
jgi:Glycosyl transferase family 2